ncbi:hypothetical protein ACQ4WQ_06225 [Janthinobacterium sp. GB1R12]|uniref:hypothetical protein n=1 Tax=Janthinobacterium sp. GB1R12 TaxID=3424190 RepID=UPI003F205907
MHAIHQKYCICTLLLLSILSAGCTSKPKAVDTVSIVPKDTGFQCLPVPSTWMAAGSIFSVDQAGTSFQIGTVDTIKPSGPRPAAFPEYSSSTNFNVGLFLSTLAALTNATGWNAQVGANAANNLLVTSKYDRPTLMVIEGQPEADAINWFSNTKHYRIEPGVRYYLVREALLADNAAYEIKRDDLSKISAEASVRDMVKGKLSLGENKSNTAYVLSAKFPQPLNVCIKPKELRIASSGSGGIQRLELVEVGQPIRITGWRQK